MGTNQTKFHDPYLSDLSKKSVWTVTLGPLKNTDEFLKILVEDQQIHDLLGYINTITHITHVEYTGRITNNIKITFVCDKNENINEAYITQKIRESISRHAELSDGKYYKNLLVKDVKLETEEYKYSFRKSIKKNLKSPQTRKSKKTPTLHKSKKCSIRLKSLKNIKNRSCKKRSK
jgi:hypothetical protein